MSRHPIDWLIHAFLCLLYTACGLSFVYIQYGWFIITSVVFVAAMVEHEQWKLGWPDQSLYEYLMGDAGGMGDLIADAVGIIAGIGVYIMILYSGV